jgi:hemerythrin HHE cation binding domain-containing protein
MSCETIREENMKMRTDNMIGDRRRDVRPGRRCGRYFIRGSLLAIGFSLVVTVAAQTPKTEAHAHSSSKFPIPEAIRAEHAEIHEQLVAATKVQGKVGEAARKLAAVLDPHFQREEEIALPPLALLAPLSRGEFRAEMHDVLPMTGALRAELPRMLEEHKAIEAATTRMGEVAKAEGNAAVERLAETLKLHAQSEEQIFYPAALLVGDMVRSHSTANPAHP